MSRRNNPRGRKFDLHPETSSPLPSAFSQPKCPGGALYSVFTPAPRRRPDHRRKPGGRRLWSRRAQNRPVLGCGVPPERFSRPDWTRSASQPVSAARGLPVNDKGHFHSHEMASDASEDLTVSLITATAPPVARIGAVATSTSPRPRVRPSRRPSSGRPCGRSTSHRRAWFRWSTPRVR